MKDVIKALKSERKGHVATVKRIDAAIAKLGGSVAVKRRKRRSKTGDVDTDEAKPSKKDRKKAKKSKGDKELSKAERRAAALEKYKAEDGN